MERRLTTILAADIANFSRLVGDDEEGALAAQREHRQQLIDPLIAQHVGRVANTAGDSLLVEFPSAVEAVRCAVAVQAGMAERNANIPAHQRIEYRMGINVGDVVAEGEDLLGDGVNVAARLEGLALPGGIVLGRAARDQVRDRLDLKLADLGEIAVKNIARPVRAFQVVRDGEAVIKPATSRNRRSLKATVAASLLIIFVAGGWWWLESSDIEPANPAKMAYPLPDKPSIAVLAFDNLSADPGQGFLSDGLTADIISSLGRIPELFVIARNSSFTYKGQAVRVQQVAEELGVRYVVEGSVQRSGDRLRVTVQLIDALGGQHLWSQKFDRRMTDLFEVKDEITLKIIGSIADKLDDVTGTYISGRDDDLEAWLLVAESIPHIEAFSAEGEKRAGFLLERAVEVAPSSPTALSQLGGHHVRMVTFGWSDDPAISLRHAKELADRAIEADPAYAHGYTTLALYHSAQRNYATSIKAAHMAIERAPNSQFTHSILGLGYLWNMEADRSIAAFEEALRLSPFAPAWVFQNFAEALEMAQRYDEAIEGYTRSLAQETNGFVAGECHLGLAISYDATGRPELAQEHIAKAREIIPGISIKLLEQFAQHSDPKYIAKWLATLKRLGVPD